VPSYLFHCNQCLKPFTKQLSVQEREKGGAICPFCWSNDVKQQISTLFPVVAKKIA
jgi:putative FmdB family regulatory protein